ncbi:2-isopropylmalate synthase [Marinobacterium halophilum]|uniref:2-isopropylmalate synthase n=1 Tax=Marinobacterium halophilum TaxID=267374 RepID=A0A2P8EVK7_9GAMM|nr:2-isopropylmalate synthase [Marinobacterium halophilum]PSL13465.1 2-isopropylmalate synthase [Marinobacterium halophilum]
MASANYNHRKYQPVEPITGFTRTWPDRQVTEAPIWASVDLRDGNQALLEPMNVAQKQRLWHLLVKLGIKEIEVGFPSASQPDYDFTRWLIEENQIPDDVRIQVLVQAREELIAKTFEALKGVKQAVVHVYNSTSRIQRERVFGMGRDEIKAIAVRGATWVKQYADQNPDTDWTFEYSPESFTSTEVDYSVEVCEAVMDAWQPTPEKRCILNLPTTVEVGPASHFADQVEYFCQHLSRRESAIISVHTHNDRGGAVASAELALMAGADRVEGTLLGNGERTGNMDIVTLAINLYSQGIDPQLDLSNPDEIIQTCTECTGLPIHPRHPWIGELVYTAFSGSHQDAIRKSLKQQQDDEPWQVAYLPIDPTDLGRDYQAVIRVNSQSGKGGMTFLLERDFGISIPRWMQLELAPMVQKISETRGGELDSQVIHDLLVNHFVQDKTPVSLDGYRIERSGTAETLAADIQVEGEAVSLAGNGKGAMAAFIDAWQARTGLSIHVVDYAEHAMGEGSDVAAAAYVQLNVEGQRVSGMAVDADTVSASLKAVVSGLNRSGKASQIAANTQTTNA